MSICSAFLPLVGGGLYGNGNLWPRRSVRRYVLNSILYFESSPDGDDICNGNYRGHHLIVLGKVRQIHQKGDISVYSPSTPAETTILSSVSAVNLTGSTGHA